MNKIKDQIISMLIDHSRLIYSVVSDMGVFYSGWVEDYEANKENLENKQTKMQLVEEDADEIKIHLIKEFSEAETQGLQGYVSLILSMDNVINYAIEFTDMLGFIDTKISDEIKKRYHKLINTIIKMADALKKTIKSLRDNPEDVFHNTTVIHEIENEIDNIFREFLNYIYDNENLEIRLLLRIRDSIMLLENLADRIHDIADVIRLLRYQ